MAVLASAGILNESVAARRTSDNLELELSSLLSIQPLLSSKDRVSLAEVTGLGVAVTWASRSARGEKLRVFCDDVEFWLLMVPREGAQGPFFCLDMSLIVE